MPNKTFLSFFWNFVPKNTFFGCKEWTRGELDPPSPQKRQKEANIHFCSQIRWKLTLPLLTPLPFRIWLYSWFTPVTHKQKFSQYFTSRPDPSLKKNPAAPMNTCLPKQFSSQSPRSPFMTLFSLSTFRAHHFFPLSSVSKSVQALNVTPLCLKGNIHSLPPAVQELETKKERWIWISIYIVKKERKWHYFLAKRGLP